MITRRTWALLAATVIAFLASLLYWDQRHVINKHEVGEIGWDYNEFGATARTAYTDWITVGKVCATALGISLLVDFITNRRKRA
jgi:hypothetical protein